MAAVSDVQGICVGGGKYVLLELELHQGELLDELAVNLLVLVGEVGAVAGEASVAILEQSHLVRLQSEFLPFLIDGLHFPEESGVECGIHREFGGHRSDFLRNLLHLVVGVGLHQVVEDAGDPLEVQSAVLQGHDGVLEIRFGAVRDYGVDFGLGLRYGGLESREIMLVFDLVELWRTVRERRFIQKRVFHFARADCKGQQQAGCKCLIHIYTVMACFCLRAAKLAKLFRCHKSSPRAVCS